MIKTALFTVMGLGLSSLAYAAPGDVVNMWAAPTHGNSAMPSGLGWDGTHLWISSPPAAGALYNRISQHNAYTGAVLSYFDHNPTSNNHHGLSFDTPTTMFTDRFYSQIVQLDVQGNELRSYAAQGDVYGVAYVADTGSTDAILYQIDILTHVLYGLNPTTGAVTSSVALGFTSAMTAGLAWDGVALWVVSTTDDTLYRVDPSTGAVLTSFAAPGNSPSGLAWDGSCLWLSDTSSDLIYRIDHGVSSLAACTALSQPDAGVVIDAGSIVPNPDSGLGDPGDTGVVDMDSGSIIVDAIAPPSDAGSIGGGDAEPVFPDDTGVVNMDSGVAQADIGFFADARTRDPVQTQEPESSADESGCSCRTGRHRKSSDHQFVLLLGVIALVALRKRQH